MAKYYDTMADDWEELTAAEVIPADEMREANEYDKVRDDERIMDAFMSIRADCRRELDRLIEFVTEDHLGKSPDNLTYADVGDASALYEKLVNINASLGLYQSVGD